MSLNCPHCGVTIQRERVDRIPEGMLLKCCGYVIYKDPPELAVDAEALNNEERRINRTKRVDDDGNPRRQNLTWSPTMLERLRGFLATHFPHEAVKEFGFSPPAILSAMQRNGIKCTCRREFKCVSCGATILWGGAGSEPKYCKACAQEHRTHLNSDWQKKNRVRKGKQRAEMAEKGAGA